MQSTKSLWAPDETLFDLVNNDIRGIYRVKDALRLGNLNLEKRIITSKDDEVIGCLEILKISSMPAGFKQHQLPILLPSENTMYFLTTCQPNAVFPEHRHSHDNGLRVILTGSINYEGKELVSGDWLYIPKGFSYSFTVGKEGCLLFHAYGPVKK